MWNELLFLETEVALVVTAVASVVFVVGYGLRSPWWTSVIGRHQMGIRVLLAVDAAVLALLAMGIMLPLWFYAALYTSGAVLAVQLCFIYFDGLHRYRESAGRGVLGAMKTPKLFGREPALWIAAISALATMLLGLGFPGLNDGVIAGMTLVLNAAAATWTAFLTRPIAPTVFTGLITAIATWAAAWGWDLAQGQVASVTFAVTAFMMLVTRNQVTPEIADPADVPRAYRDDEHEEGGI